MTGGRHNLKDRYEKTDSDKDDAQSVDWNTPNELRLQCLYLEFDGVSLGPKEKTIHISPYVGEKRIEDLEYFPSQFCRDSDGLLHSLHERGKKFMDCRYGYGAYEGMAVRYDPGKVQGEVLVDFKSGYEANPQWREDLGELNTSNRQQSALVRLMSLVAT